MIATNYTPLSRLLASTRKRTKAIAEKRAAKTEELRKEIALRDFTQWADAARRDGVRMYWMDER